MTLTPGDHIIEITRVGREVVGLYHRSGHPVWIPVAVLDGAAAPIQYGRDRAMIGSPKRSACGVYGPSGCTCTLDRDHDGPHVSKPPGEIACVWDRRDPLGVRLACGCWTATTPDLLGRTIGHRVTCGTHGSTGVVAVNVTRNEPPRSPRLRHIIDWLEADPRHYIEYWAIAAGVWLPAHVTSESARRWAQQRDYPLDAPQPGYRLADGTA